MKAPLGRLRMVARSIVIAPLALATLGCGRDDPAQSSEAVFKVNAEARIVSPSPTSRGFFGNAVAVDQNTLVVGAWGEGPAGKAHVFELHEGRWEHRATLLPDTADAGQRFGHAVAIHRSTIVVGAVYDSKSAFRSGAAHVFEMSGGMWQRRAVLNADQPVDDQRFGASVAVYEDFVAVGAPGPRERSVYSFRRSDDIWEPDQIIQPESAIDRERFGSGVALKSDLLVVGAWRDDPVDDDDRGAGRVLVYELGSVGWVKVADLAGGPGDFSFGAAVSTTGKAIAVGTPRRYVDVYGQSGATWTSIGRLSSEQPHYGASVALSEGVLAVGAPGGAGGVKLYRVGDNGWQPWRTLVPAHEAEAVHFGIDLALSDDYVVVGATGDSSGGVAAGAVYVVRLE